MESLGFIIVCICVICYIWKDRKEKLEDIEFENWKPSDYWKLPNNSHLCWNEDDLSPIYPLGCSVEECTFQSAAGCGIRFVSDIYIVNSNNNCPYYISHKQVVKEEQEAEEQERKLLAKWEQEEKDDYSTLLLEIEETAKKQTSKP